MDCIQAYLIFHAHTEARHLQNYSIHLFTYQLIHSWQGSLNFLALFSAMRPELQVANTLYTWIKHLMSSGAEGQWRRCPELFFIVFVFGRC